MHLVWRLRGGGPLPSTEQIKELEQKKIEAQSAEELAIAPGGFIQQTIIRDKLTTEGWDSENCIMFDLQLLDAAALPALGSKSLSSDLCVFEKLIALDLPESKANV